MRIGVLPRNMDYWTTRKIIKAGHFKGCGTEFLRTGDVQLRVNGTRFDAFYGGRSFRI